MLLDLRKWSKCAIICGLLVALFVPVQSQRTTSTVEKRYREKEILDQILSKSGTYDTNIRPSGGNSTRGETPVTVNILINSISKIDDFSMEYTVQLTLREDWVDDRLAFSHLDRSNSIKYLTISEMNRVWTPDLFFINEKNARFHNIIQPNVYVRIFPDGKVSMSMRLSLTLSCSMDLQLFPMDTQKCGIIMASYAWTTDDLDFQWRETDAVQLPNMTLPRFSLEEIVTSTCDRHTVTGIYSCIRVDFTLTRNFSYYLTQMYIPCFLLVIVSWVSFWLDENSVPARAALGITTLLTMATHQANMNSKLPPVSYVKALDVWSGTCLVFIFAALLEYTLVNYATRFDKRKKAERPNDYRTEQGSLLCGFLSGKYTTSKKIDVTSRVLFPFLFLIFNIVYWIMYKVVLV